MDRPLEYTRTWSLTAGETDARGLMPVTLVAARAIETATRHADALDIGYSNLVEHRLGWVLARLTIEMVRYPSINETYSMTTWIEGYNRFFSDRCYLMTDADGRPLAHIRSVWVAIDMQTRRMANLAELERDAFPVVERPCPVPKSPRPVLDRDAGVAESSYTFKNCDIDFNRHVNTIRYLDLVLNLRPLDFYDRHDIVLLDASFDHECYFGREVSLLTGRERRDQSAEITEIIRDDGERAVGVKLKYSPVEKKQ
ncbi:MAG: thioesterase [Bacteroidales bacterium]|nr:thioesterase [Bacteroidales bacterium]